MSAQYQAHKTGSAGFTLIELMVTVAIVGILATIAATSYQSQVLKAHRTDARSALLDLAGREEKLFSTTNAYSAAPSDLGYGSSSTIAVSANYNVSISVPTAITFVLTATPINSQLADTTCATLTLDQTGLQGSTGSGTAATCWGN